MATSRKGKTPAAKPRSKSKPAARAAKPRGNPDGPPVRGRRNHSLIDDNPTLRQLVITLKQEHPDWIIDQKLAWISAHHPEFRHLSWSALQRWYKSFEELITEGETLAWLAKSLNEGMNHDALALSTSTVNMAQTLIARKFLSGEAITDDEDRKIHHAIKGAAAVAASEKVRRNEEKLLRRSADLIKADLRQAFAKRPDLGREVEAYVDRHTESLIEEISRR